MHLGVNLFGNKGFVDFPENLRRIYGKSRGFPMSCLTSLDGWLLYSKDWSELQ